MVRPKTIPRRNHVHRRTRFPAFRNYLRLGLVRPPLLVIGPYLHPVVHEKLHIRGHRETLAPISVSRSAAGQATTGKVQARKRLPTIPLSRMKRPTKNAKRALMN
jgi:hypothetical protein